MEGGCWVLAVVTLIVEWNCLEGIFGLFDIGTGSNFVVLELERPSGVAVDVLVGVMVPLSLRNDLVR